MLISDFGMIFKVSEKNWLEFLKNRSKGKWVDIDKYGKFIGQIDETITDLTTDQAKALIKDIDDERRNRAVKSRNKATRGANKTKG